MGQTTGARRVLKAAGMAALVVAAVWITISERSGNRELVRWEGRHWAVACTDPEGRTWRLATFAVLDGSSGVPRWRLTDRGIAVEPPEGAPTYKTSAFEHRALAREGVWRWRTPPRGTGLSKRAYAGLPPETAEVEVAAAHDAVRWRTRAGAEAEWPCTAERRKP